MRITLDALVVLDAIDRAGSFASAAERLYRVPSAVSYTVHKLEQDLGVAIFDRSGHRARLTAAGARLLKDGRDLLQLAEEVERRVRGAAIGWEAQLVIVASDAFPRGALYELVRAFHETPQHQLTHLELRVEPRAACWSTLLSGKTDLVVGTPEPAPRADGIAHRTLGEVPLSLVVPAGHPLARAAEPIPPAVVAQHTMVRQSPSEAADHAHSATDLVTVGDFESQVHAIRCGLGVGYVPAGLVQDDVTAGRLVLKATTEVPTMRLGVAWRALAAGNGLQWFVSRLCDGGQLAALGTVQGREPERHALRVV
jgi:DNA-binding transcriptional LysR family regulator